jgi:hypothetical protein
LKTGYSLFFRYAKSFACPLFCTALLFKFVNKAYRV